MTTTQPGSGNGAAPDGGFPLTGMVGRVLHGVEENRGDLTVTFGGHPADGDTEEYRFAHEQDCCEHVRIVRYAGNIASALSGPTILSATVWVWSNETPMILRDIGASPDESYTWTRLVIDTDGGLLEVVWLGTSNGWYNEGVSISDYYGRPVEVGGAA